MMGDGPAGFRAMAALAGLGLAILGGPSSSRGQVVLAEQRPDPHGFPRPARDARDVPLRTSLYLELKVGSRGRSDTVDPESVAVEIQEKGGQPRVLLSPGGRFAPGYSGRLAPRQDMAGTKLLTVNVDGGDPLRPATTHTVRVSARSKLGAELPAGQGEWSFTTEGAKRGRKVALSVDLGTPSFTWHGAFFSGFCNVIFCTDEALFGKTYALMADARREHPRAWSLQRDFWMTGTEYQRQFFPNRLPNIVRERETRRIRAVDTNGKGNDIVLRVEDVFGNAQYGIAANRPLAGDYHPGDEVLVADGVHSARTRVIAVDETAKAIRVAAFAVPEGGWTLEYGAPLPTREDPDAPGLFASGGCYLRKHDPPGTPCYYWGRLDKEWDLAHRRNGRRLLVNFADAAGDLARDGRDWTAPKDYAEWHDVVIAITGHVIDRYGGDDALTFVWSVFNEPDLLGIFWRADWNELQTFYDYTVDGILRAFEDRGLDANRVFVGGLELGGIFGTNLRLTEFLAHCSPRAQAKGALSRNAAVADRRLDGKRSQRVETLCAASGGKGTPCDFISIHSYNRSEVMAAKLIRAKEQALAVDPDYYAKLWVNSFEACPEWNPPPDGAAADSYLGNGYFPSWCADVSTRQLRKAADDPRYAFGETILTVWPPNKNFGGSNAVSRNIDCDDDGDGRADRVVTVPEPIFHVLSLLSDLGPNYWVVPARRVGGHTISGFASKDAKATRVLLYAHHDQDTQSRSGAEFAIDLELAGLDAPAVKVTEYRFDKDHNSYFALARKLRDRATEASTPAARLDALVRQLDADDLKTQRAALDALAELGPRARGAVGDLFRRIPTIRDEAVKAAALVALKQISRERPYSRAEVEQVEALAKVRPTGESTRTSNSGTIHLPLELSGNGVIFAVIEHRAR